MYYPGLMILGVVRGVLPVGEPMMLISYLELKTAETWGMEVGGGFGRC